jgi:2-octaprenyl-6-methoxyphenol hydroxylase
LALKNAPLRIGVVEALSAEQRLAASPGDRALALSRGTAQILGQLGVWEDVTKRSMPIRHIHVSDRGHIGKTRLHAEAQGVDALGYVIVARVLEAAIESALQALAVDRLCPARIVGIQGGRDAVCVSLKQGAEDVHLTARLVVAADGGNSTVRKLLGIEQEMRDYGQTAIVTEVRTEYDNCATAYERFTVNGPLAMLPLEKRKASVVWTLPPERATEVLEWSEAEFIARLQHEFGYWLGRIESASPRQGFPLRLIRSERMAGERVLLIGNAMHQLHPVAGQGFNLGCRDAQVLARNLRDQLALRRDIGAQAVLEQYARTRAEDLDKVIRFTDSLVRVFSTASAPVVLARNAALLALECLPAAKCILARHAMGYGIRL